MTNISSEMRQSTYFTPPSLRSPSSAPQLLLSSRVWNRSTPLLSRRPSVIDLTDSNRSTCGHHSTESSPHWKTPPVQSQIDEEQIRRQKEQHGARAQADRREPEAIRAWRQQGGN
ncbi:hypothetical protein LXL04_002631 [Taraxacum kok-saghyz]